MANKSNGDEEEIKLPKDAAAWYKILTWISSIVITVALAASTFASDRAGLQNDLSNTKVEVGQMRAENEDIKRVLVEQQKQGAKLNESVAVLTNDVAWIKKRMEEQMVKSGK